MTGNRKGFNALRHEAVGCRRCHLWEHATQTVFGEGPVDARLMLVGEQPGDREDLEGRPFVGPAGEMLDRALADAGLSRNTVYITNAVKHFKFAQRGKRRLHQRPDAHEMERCHWWLDRELALIEPGLVLSMGVTATRALLGKTVTISRMRGDVFELNGVSSLLVTVHPSYLLRIRDPADKRREYKRFVADIEIAKEWIEACSNRPA